MIRLPMFALGFFYLTIGLAAAAEEKPSEHSAAERLLSQEGGQLEEAQSELLAARAKLIADLSGIIRDHENQRHRTAAVHSAMFILGEMRAPEAAEVLAEYIGFPQVLPPGRGILVIPGGMGRRWRPAAEALIKIGAPCVPAVVDKLAHTDNSDEGEACLAVLDALRKRDSVSQVLEKAIARERDAKRRSRLEAGLSLLSEGQVAPLSHIGWELFRTPRWPPRAPAP
jgi:hypothetical protein